MCIEYDRRMTGGHHNKKAREHNMKFFNKVEKCGLSPMRKFHRTRGGGKGTRRQHLSPQHRPARRTDSSRVFRGSPSLGQPVLAYAPSPGIPELIDAIQNYYDKLDMHFDKSEIYVTHGGKAKRSDRVAVHS